MDIDLLSKMVKELILDQDRVVLPGLGSFVAEIVPSTFSDKGYTINPPYRRLYFRSKPDEGDELIEFYASSNNIAPEMAGRIIKDFLSELKTILHEKKTIVFPGLGRLRATKENHLFFVADEELDIYPEGFGLEPVSLKTHQETPEQLTAAVADLRAMLEEREAEQAASVTVQMSQPQEPVQVEQESEPESAEEVQLAAVPEQEAETPEEQPIQQEEAIELVGEEPVMEAEPEQEAFVEVISEPDPAQEASAEPVSEAVAEAEPEVPVEPVSEEIAEPIVEPEQIQVPEIKEEAVPVQKVKVPAWKKVLKVLMWLLIIAVVFLAAFVVLGHMCPDIVDRLLYTPEEMEIVNIL